MIQQRKIVRCGSLVSRRQIIADAGRIEEACAKFQESQRLDQALGTLLYFGHLLLTGGQTASAWAAFQSAQELAHRRKDKARETIARERAASLEPTLSMLQSR